MSRLGCQGFCFGCAKGLTAETSGRQVDAYGRSVSVVERYEVPGRLRLEEHPPCALRITGAPVKAAKARGFRVSVGEGENAGPRSRYSAVVSAPGRQARPVSACYERFVKPVRWLLPAPWGGPIE